MAGGGSELRGVISDAQRRPGVERASANARVVSLSRWRARLVIGRPLEYLNTTPSPSYTKPPPCSLSPSLLSPVFAPSASAPQEQV